MTETSKLTTFKRCGVERVAVRFHCLSDDASVSARLLATLKNRLVADSAAAAAVLPALVFADGREIGRSSNGPDTVAELDAGRRGPANADVFDSHFPVVFQVARG